MHDCRKTREQLTEFLLVGASGQPSNVLSAELRGCAECRAEFDALSATLRLTTRLRETAAPAESYWPGYHARLRQKLLNANALDHNQSEPSRLIRFLKASVPVPAPVGVALIFACALLVPVGIRNLRPRTIQTTSIVQVPVEVPVIRERIVTRVVYKERRSSSRSSTQVNDASKGESALARSQKPRNEGVPVSLVGFKPTEEIKLTVIKGGSANEK